MIYISYKEEGVYNEDGKTQAQVAREEVGAPYLEIFKVMLDKALSSLICERCPSAHGRRGGLDDLKCSLPTQAILRFSLRDINRGSGCGRMI